MHTASEMNGRARRPVTARGAKAAPKGDRMMQKVQGKAMPVKAPTNAAANKGVTNRIQSRRERKLALQQDVDKLKKKLRHEENIHRALERAFTRPLGVLPRLPPYLPSHTLALLAEVAVLEEEVLRLEEQVVSFQQGIYQDAIILSSAKNTHLAGGDGCEPPQLMPSSPIPNSELPPMIHHGSDHPNDRTPPTGVTGGNQTTRKPAIAAATRQDDRTGTGKENQSCSNNPARNCRISPSRKVTKPRAPAAAPEKRRAAQTTSTAPDRKSLVEAAAAINNWEKVCQNDDDSSEPNKLSEELLRCLLTIFTQMGSSSSGQEEEQAPLSPSVSGSRESLEPEDAYPQDPYGILELGTRDIGPYRQLHVVHAASFNRDALSNNTLLALRLKALLRQLSSVDLVRLSHQQKLAFWINIYNSCMMNAFLEQGIPTTPHMLVAMMPKATMEIGGRTHNAMSIEHFILRPPYSVKHVNPEGAKSEDAATTATASAFGLEWPEPLVTFALSCGSWSSPAVRVYTAGRVEEELEAAKREYLQARVGVSSAEKLAIPKLLHWYLPDFAKDVDSLVDWVCLQLPGPLRQSAMRTVDDGSRLIQVLPYEFRFRYLLSS